MLNTAMTDGPFCRAYGHLDFIFVTGLAQPANTALTKVFTVQDAFNFPTPGEQTWSAGACVSLLR